MIKTKADLWAVMKKHKACREALLYVKNHESKTAIAIGMACARRDWFLWLLAREGRLDGFIRECLASLTDKKISHATIQKVNNALTVYDKDFAKLKLWLYIDAAFKGNWAVQLNKLHIIWKNWCNDV